MKDAGFQAAQLAANQIKLDFVERPGASSSAKINFAAGIFSPSSDACGKVQQLRHRLQIRSRACLGGNSLSDCRERRDPALAHFARQAYRLQRRINLELQRLGGPVHEMRGGADAAVGMFGGVVIIPGSFGIALLRHAGDVPSLQSRESISACGVAAFKRGSRMATLRPRKPVVDYRLSRTSCPHGTEIVFTEALSECFPPACVSLVSSSLSLARPTPKQ